MASPLTDLMQQAAREAALKLPAEAKKEGLTVPVLRNIPLKQYLEGAFDREMAEAAAVRRKHAPVLASRQTVALWAEPVKRLNPSHDFKHDSMGPNPIFRNGKKKSGI